MATIVNRGDNIEITNAINKVYNYQKGTVNFQIDTDKIFITNTLGKNLHEIPIASISDPSHTDANDLRTQLRAFFFHDLIKLGNAFWQDSRGSGSAIAISADTATPFPLNQLGADNFDNAPSISYNNSTGELEPVKLGEVYKLIIVVTVDTSLFNAADVFMSVAGNAEAAQNIPANQVRTLIFLSEVTITQTHINNGIPITIESDEDIDVYNTQIALLQIS